MPMTNLPPSSDTTQDHSVPPPSIPGSLATGMRRRRMRRASTAGMAAVVVEKMQKD